MRTAQPPDPGLVVVMLHGHGMRASDLSPFASSLKVAASFHHPQGPHELPDGTRAWWPKTTRRPGARPPESGLAAPGLAGSGPGLAGLAASGLAASGLAGPAGSGSAAPGVAVATGQAPSGWQARDLAAIRPIGSVAARGQLVAWLNDPALVPTSSKVVLAGFSQGGMLACDTALLADVRFDALALFSSAPIALEEWRPRLDRVAGKPVLVAHGRHDEELSLSCGEALRDHLGEAGADVDWLMFDGGHQMPLAVWRRFRKFLQNIAQGERGETSP